MRFASLGSGSRGNGTLIRSADTTLLVDCGFSAREATERLQRQGVDPTSITAILVTHEHDDHIGGVGVLARKFNLPAWMTEGTRRSAQHILGSIPSLNIFSSHEAFDIGDVHVDPIAVPHDASEPSQFVFGDGDVRIGLLTDVGRCTPHICRLLSGVQALLLEFNHDEQMLREGPYPESLKQRVGGTLGHLSNTQSADLLRQIDTQHLRHLVAMHLSQQNNLPDIVQRTAAAALQWDLDQIGIANQDHGYNWTEV
ncbi:MAG: MBL fold metallo-hydrolase [Gammaproteobacteria bacterium]